MFGHLSSGENSPFAANVSDVATTGNNLAGKVTSCRTVVSECRMPCICLREENKSMNKTFMS